MKVQNFNQKNEADILSKKIKNSLIELSKEIRQNLFKTRKAMESHSWMRVQESYQSRSRMKVDQ
jgi:hypothetical protein